MRRCRVALATRARVAHWWYWPSRFIRMGGDVCVVAGEIPDPCTRGTEAMWLSSCSRSTCCPLDMLIGQ